MPKTQTILNVRVDLDMLERLDALADVRDMSRSELVRAMLEYCIDQFEQGALDASPMAVAPK